MLSNSLFPPKGAMVIETSAAFGVMFFFFIIGVKMDPATLMKTEKKAIIIGLSVFIFTFSIPTGLSLFMTTHVSMDKSLSNSLPLIAGSQSFTAFVVIAILLTELKILNTDIGRLAMSAAMFNDIVGFTFTAVQFAVMQNKGGTIVRFFWIILSVVGLFVGIFYVMRPILLRISKNFSSEKHVNEWFIIFVLFFVLITGLLSEIIGQHYIMGPLLLGLAIPEGPPIGTSLIAKMETFSFGFFYPTYLAITGLQTNLFKIDYKSMWIVSTIVIVSIGVKIGAVMLPGYYNNIPLKECFVIGLILNARGIAELVVYNLWRGTKVQY
jgi:Kef-type K+ transport system membrane component KefB